MGDQCRIGVLFPNLSDCTMLNCEITNSKSCGVLLLSGKLTITGRFNLIRNNCQGGKKEQVFCIGKESKTPWEGTPYYERQCYTCKEIQNDTNTMSLCHGCHKIRYCGTICRTKDWSRHQIICNPHRRKKRKKRERKQKRKKERNVANVAPVLTTIAATVVTPVVKPAPAATPTNCSFCDVPLDMNNHKACPCKTVFYCKATQCQNDAWTDHKPEHRVLMKIITRNIKKEKKL